jgi:hypothetical protein
MKKKILKFEIKIFNIEINKNIYFLNFLIKFTFKTYIKLLYVFYKFNVIKIFSFIFKNNKC